MITTLMITCIPLFSSFPPHAYCYPYPASLTFYDTNVHRFVNPPVPTFPYIVALPYFSPSHYFRFLLNPTSFLRVFTFFEPLMIRQTPFFCYTFLSHFVFISESLINEGSRRDYSRVYLYQRTPILSLPVSNVSSCISSHSLYIHINNS